MILFIIFFGNQILHFYEIAEHRNNANNLIMKLLYYQITYPIAQIGR